MAITRLSGGTTPANGSDPRTFPTIWNAAADDIEAAESAISTLQSDLTNLEIDDLADVTITTPADGEVLTYDDGTSEWVNQALPASGKILQVVSSTLSSTFSVSVAANTEEELVGLSATITPSSASSTILVMATLSLGDGLMFFSILRDGTKIGIGDAATTRQRITSGGNNQSISPGVAAMVFEDTPASTSALTYSFNLHHGNTSTTTIFVNLGSADASVSPVYRSGRAISTITLMEVAG